MKKFKKIWSIIWPYLPLILIFFLSWQLSSHVILISGDDTAYLTQAQNKPLFDFLFGQYQRWSGRLIPEGFLYLFIKQNLIYWRLFHLFLNSLLAFCLSYLCVLPVRKPWPRFFLNFFIVFGTFLFNQSTLIAGSYWVTASFNFLLPAVAIIFVLIPLQKILLHQKSSWWLNILAVIAIIIASYQEQAALSLLLITFGVTLYDFYQHRRPHWWLMTFLSLSLTNTLISLLAPGNFQRLTIETQKWYPELTQLSFLTKIWRGTEWVTQHFFTKEISLWFLFFSLLTLLIWQKPKIFFGAVILYSSPSACFFSAFSPIFSSSIQLVRPLPTPPFINTAPSLLFSRSSFSP